MTRDVDGFCGIDSIPYRRLWGEKEFISVLGSCVITKDIDSFNGKYNEVIEKILKINGLKRTRPVYSSCSLQKLFKNSDLCFKSLERILKEMESEIEKIRFMFSSYPKTPEIFMFGDKRISKLPPKDFIKRHLFNSYPHICAWKIIEEGYNYKIYTDAFFGYITKAWKEIENYNDLHVYLNGDECVPIISLTDIVLRILSKRLEDNSLFIGKSEIQKSFKSYDKKVEVDYIGRGMLPRITPINNIPIPFERNLKHPIFFVMMPKTSFVSNRTFLESPRGNLLFRIVHSNNGCIKFYDKKDDSELIKDGDFLVYFNEEGKKSAELIESFGININKINIKKIDKLTIKK